MHVTLRGPSDERWQIDTPDAALVGVWLKGIFDSFGDYRPGFAPLQFTLEIR